MGKRKGRLGCVEFVDGAYVFTDVGLAKISQLASLGSSVAEIARYMRVTTDVIASRIDIEHDNYNEDVADAYADGLNELTEYLREGQRNLAVTNAQMSIHMGKHFLGQKDVQEINVNKRVHIVGTLPDYSQGPDEWLKNFAPSALTAQPAQPAQVIDADFTESKDD